MMRRITCCVVFVTLLWRAHTDDEKKVRDMFKSNMTRKDFSNLLQSLINLNEQRVSVLQKLYRLEDYGVLSEVLRSSDKTTVNENPNNLFLIVMSKNQNDPSRRKLGLQVMDSVPSFSTGNNNIHPKLDFVLDPASYIPENIRKENRLESIFRSIPRVSRPSQILRADDTIKKITTKTKTLKYTKLGLLKAAKTSLKVNEDRKHHDENSRYERVNNKGRHPNASEKLLNDNGKSNKYPQTVGYNSQSNEYLEIDFPIENDKLTTKPFIIKHILSSNHKNSKYPIEGKGEQDEDDYGSPLSNIKNDRNRQYTKMISDISIKKLHDYGQYPKANKYTPKIKVQSKLQNGKLTTKPIIIKHIVSSNYKNSKHSIEGKGEQDDYGFPFSDNDHNSQHRINTDISIKNLHVNNHHNSKSNMYTSKVIVQRNQQNDKLTTKRITIKDMSPNNRQNTKYPLEDKDEQDDDFYGSPFSNIENDHNSQDTNINTDISVKKLHDNNHHVPKTNKNILKVKVLSNQQNNKLSTKRITIKDMSPNNRQNTKYPLEDKGEQDEDFYGSPFSNIENNNKNQDPNINSDVSIKTLRVNYNQNPKTKTNTPKVKVLSNQQNNKLTTKRITIKDMSPNNHQNTKYPLEDKGEQDEDFYGSPFSNTENNNKNQDPNINSDVSSKNLRVNYNQNPKTNKNTPKVLSNQQNNKLATVITIKDILSSNRQNTKYPIEGKDEQHEDYYGSPFSNIENNHKNQYTNINSDVSTKTLRINNHHNPKINNNTPNIEIQSNQNLKIKENRSNLNKTAIDINTRTNDYRIKYGTVNSTASENNHSIKNPNVNNDKKNVNNHDLIYTNVEQTDKNKFLTLASKNGYGTKPIIPETTKDMQYAIYPGFEDHKDVRLNSNKDKPKTVIDMPYGSYPGFEDHKDVRDTSNKSNTATELPYGDNLKAVSKKDTDYYGVKMFDNGKKSGEEFSVVITNVGNGTAEEVKQHNDPKLILKAFDQPKSKHIGRKPFTKCLDKKALKLCRKSCISAYKNVCQRYKCTSRSKKALKKECKRSCKKTFRSSSKYSDSDENSDENSDSSYSDDSS